MTKKELIDKIRSISTYKKSDVENILTLLLAAISDALAEGERVEFRGFGTFYVRTRQSRTARNPRTGTPVSIAEHKAPAWKPSKTLKERVDKNDTD